MDDAARGQGSGFQCGKQLPHLAGAVDHDVRSGGLSGGLTLFALHLVHGERFEQGQIGRVPPQGDLDHFIKEDGCAIMIVHGPIDVFERLKDRGKALHNLKNSDLTGD